MMSSKTGSYGVDAPGLVCAFLGVGIVSAVGGLGVLNWAGHRSWAVWVCGVLLIVSAYGLGMFCYMLWGSLVTKVRGREAILDLVSWTGSEFVLDVGCGRGLMLVGAAHRLTTGQATGIDLWLGRDQSGNSSHAPLDNAQAEGVADRVQVVTGDIRALPFEDESFDVVLSHWVVHNLGERVERSKALAEMARVLRPGGTVVLTDIAHREEFKGELRVLGMSKVRLVIASQLRDAINQAVSFGSFRPATLVAVKSV